MSSAKEKYLASVIAAQSKMSTYVADSNKEEEIEIVTADNTGGETDTTKPHESSPYGIPRPHNNDKKNVILCQDKDEAKQQIKSLKPPPPPRPPRRSINNDSNNNNNNNSDEIYSYVDIGMTNEALNDTGLTSDGYQLLLDISTGLKDQTGLYRSNYRSLGLTLFYGILLVPLVKVNSPLVLLPSLLIGGLFILICIILSPANRIYKCKKEKFDKIRLKLVNLCSLLKYDELKYSDFPSFITGVRKEDKGMVLNNIGWYIVIGGYWLVLSKFFAQVKATNDGNDEYWRSRCTNYLTEPENVKDGSCLIRHVVTSCMTAYFSYLVGMFMCLYHTPTQETDWLTAKIEKNVKNRFADNKTISRMTLIDKIFSDAVNQERSVDIVTLPFFIGYHFNSWKRCAAYYTFTLIVSFNAMFGYAKTMFWDVNSENAIATYWVYFFTCPCLAFWAYAISKQLWLFNRYLFLFDYIAMSNLDGAIYIDHVKDILCWFDMRQYYTNYVQPIRSRLRGSPPFAVLLCAAIVSVINVINKLFISNEHNSALVLFQHPSYVILFVSIMVCIIAMCIFIYTAVLTWGQQLSHVGMLKREIIRLKSLIDLRQESNSNNNNNNNNNNSSLESALIITNKVVGYLEQFDQAPKIVGIPMNYAVLATAIGYIFSFTIVIGSTFLE